MAQTESPTPDPLTERALNGAARDAIAARSGEPLMLAACAFLDRGAVTAAALATLLGDVAVATRAIAAPSYRDCARAQLADALSGAQSRARGVALDAHHDHHNYDYASSEAIIAAATDALSGSGLALEPASTRIDNGLLLRRWRLTHTGGGEREFEQVWPLCERRGLGRDKVLAGALTSSLAYLLRDLLMMPRVTTSDDSLHDDRESQQQRPPQQQQRPPWVEGEHHESWSADRAGFCAALRACGGLTYDAAASALELDQKGRPSWWPSSWRVRFVARLREGGFPQLYSLPSGGGD